MAHSLGSVLMWDILCNQPELHAALAHPPASPSAPAFPAPPTAVSTQVQASLGQQAVPEQRRVPV